MVKLVATDMDGTFLTSKGFYDNQRLHNVLEKFEKNDMLFVAASGRSMLALEKMFAPHADKMAFIAENGTLVKVGEKTVFESGLTKPQFLEITDTLIESPYMTGYDFLLSGENGAYLHPKASDEYLEFISHYYENVQRVDNLANVTDNILKVTANFAEDTVRKGEAWFNQRIDYVKAVTTGFKSIDIILSDVNKRTGLEALWSLMAYQLRKLLHLEITSMTMKCLNLLEEQLQPKMLVKKSKRFLAKLSDIVMKSR